MDTLKKNPFNLADAVGEGAGEMTGLDAWQMGLRLQLIGTQQGNKALIDAAIKCYNKALSLGVPPDKTDIVYFALGKAYLNHWRTGHNRKHLDQALALFIQHPYTGSSIQASLSYVDVGEAFFSRYMMDDRSGDLEQAILHLEMAAEGIEKFGIGKNTGVAVEVQHILGNSLFQKYCLTDDPEDLAYSISNLEKVRLYFDSAQSLPGNMVDNRHKAYYDYGLVLFHRWKIYNAPSDLYASMKSILMSLGYNDVYFNSYYLLRDIFYLRGEKFEGDQCINSALYLLLRGKAEWQWKYHDLSTRIPVTQSFDALKYLQYKQLNNRLMAKDVEDLFPKMDFLVLLQFLDSKMKGGAGLRYRPVLLFYLGGIVTSYYIFDEDYDVNPDMKMTLQEQYYYARSSQLFYDYNKTLIGADSNLTYAIGNADEADGDHYYLGQLYYLRSLRSADESERSKDRDSAERHFLKCDGIWAKAMLDIVRDKTDYQAEVNDYLKNHCNSTETIVTGDIDNESFLCQFDDYFHFNEVHYSCPEYFSYDDDPERPELVYFKPIWDVFRLSESDYEELTRELRRQVGLSIQKEMASKVSGLSEEEFTRIKDELNPFQWAEDKDAVEKTAQSFIRDSNVSRGDKVLLIRYLLSQNKIDGYQYFSLVKYNEYCEDIDRMGVDLSIVKTTVAGVVGYLLGRLIHEGGLLELIVSALVMNFIKIDIKADAYSIFKQSLWVLANNEYLDEDFYRYSF